MTTVVNNQEVEAIRAVIADTEALQSNADGFARLLMEDVALVNFGGRRVLGRDNVRQAMRQALMPRCRSGAARRSCLSRSTTTG
jgi:uncharacterized protein (TIGR02246 family)